MEEGWGIASNVDYENSWPIEKTTLPPREQPIRKQPPWEQPPKEQPIREQPPWEQPPKEQPIREQPPWEQPIREQSLWEKPPKEQPIDDDESNVGLQEVIHNSFATRKIEKKLIEPSSKDSDLQWALKEDRLDDAQFVLSSPEPTISSVSRKGTADKATQTNINEINELNNVLTPLKPESFAVARKYLLEFGLILKGKNEQSISKVQDPSSPKQLWNQKDAQREMSVDNNKKGEAFLRSREVSSDSTRKQGLQQNTLRNWNAPSDKNFFNQEPWQNQDIKSKSPSYNNQSRDITFTNKPTDSCDASVLPTENPLISEPWWDNDQIRNKEARDTHRASSPGIKSDHVHPQERSFAKDSISNRALSENSLNNVSWDRKQNLNPSISSVLPQKSEQWDSNPPNDSIAREPSPEQWWNQQNSNAKSQEPRGAPTSKPPNKQAVMPDSWDSSVLPQKTEQWDSNPPKDSFTRERSSEPWLNQQNSKSQEPPTITTPPSNNVEFPVVTNKPIVKPDSWDSPVLPQTTMVPWNSNLPKDSLAREHSSEPWLDQQNLNAKSQELLGAPTIRNSSKPPSNVNNVESSIVTTKPVVNSDSWDSPVLPLKAEPWVANPQKDSIARERSSEPRWNQQNSNAKSQEPLGANSSKPPSNNVYNVESPIVTNKPIVKPDSWDSPVLPQTTMVPWNSNLPKDSLARERSSEPWFDQRNSNAKSQESLGAPAITNSLKPPSNNVESPIVTKKPVVNSDSWDSPVLPLKAEPWVTNPQKDSIARERSSEPRWNQQNSNAKSQEPLGANSSKPPSNNVYNVESPIVTNKPIVKPDSWDSPVLPQTTMVPWNSNLPKDSLARERSSEPWFDQRNSNAKSQESLGAPAITNSLKPPSNNVDSPFITKKPVVNSDSWDSPVLPLTTEQWDTNPPKDSIARERSSELRWNQQNSNAKSQEPLRANSKPPSNNVYNVESRIVTSKPVVNSDSWDSQKTESRNLARERFPDKRITSSSRVSENSLSREPRWGQHNSNAKSQVQPQIVSTNKQTNRQDSRESSSIPPPNSDSWNSNPTASAGTDSWLQQKELIEKELRGEIPRNNISATSTPSNKEVLKSTSEVFSNVEPQAAREPEPWETSTYKKSEELEPWEIDNRDNRNNRNKNNKPDYFENNIKTDYYGNSKNRYDYSGNRSRSVSTDELMRRGINCYKCKSYGHRASDCPGQNVQNVDNNYGEKRSGRGGACYECGSSEHMVSKCPLKSHPKPSPFTDPTPSGMSPEKIWDNILKAERENEPDDFRHWIEEFAKAMPDETFQSIERKLRKCESAGRIIALKREEIPSYKCLVDLKGNTGKKYVAQIILSTSVRLPRTAGTKASSEEENFRWLADAGFMVDDPTPFCTNCKQKGHYTRDCIEPKNQVERTTLPCQHCGSFEHMTKYCTNRSNNSNNNTNRNDVRYSSNSYDNRDDSLINNNEFEDRSRRNGYRGDKEAYRDSNGYEQIRDTYNNNYSRKKDDGQNYNNYSRKNDESYNYTRKKDDGQNYNNYSRKNDESYNYTRKNDDGRGSYNNFDTNWEHPRGEYQRNKEPYSSRNEKERRYDTQDNGRRYNETANENVWNNSVEESRGRSTQTKEVSSSSRPNLDN
ncbi:8315_t:CDS:2 [Diversispora eburnea]|uniref:8315_t:CDS:1 n=1 Tax=Diversispora eburnea TaxID=1213867 RepID=A0A9N8VBH4_9GLOM|nr:8315_t:CDS:2 [Diversispora eburnea]